MGISGLPTDTIEQSVRQLLVCPECHEPLIVQGARITCPASGFEGGIRDGVVMAMDQRAASFFDDKYEVMQRGHQDHNEWDFCYRQQVQLLEKYLRPGMLVVDVGCGPWLPYQKKGSFVIGLDSSFPSVRSNQDVDLRIFGSAVRMPMPDRSVDLAVCFYSLHHMVGETRAETQGVVTQAFMEFGRVIKPGGYLFVFEMTPMKPAAMLQRLAWDSMRRLLGRKLDMHFWAADFFERILQDTVAQAVLERVYFQSSLTTIIRPAFALPSLKLYRFLYPLAPKLYKFLF